MALIARDTSLEPALGKGAPQDGTIFFGPKIEMPKGFGSQFNDQWIALMKQAAEEAFGATKDQVMGFDFGDDGRVTAMAATIVNVSESLKQRVEEFTKKVDGAVKEATEKFFKRDLVVVRLDFVGYGVGKRFQQRSCSMRHKKRRRSRALERVYKERRFREFKNIWPKSIEPSGSLNLPEMLKQYSAGNVTLNFAFQPGSSPQPK